MQRKTQLFDIRAATVFMALVSGSLVVPSHASSDRASAADVHTRTSDSPKASVSDATVTGAMADAGARLEAASVFDGSGWRDASLGGIDRDVFSLALESAERAVARGDAQPSTLTVIDFSRPSTQRRLWVYDLRSRELLFEEHVSHGRNSGHDVPTAFSNEEGSYKSSLGLFRTAEGYIGKHGYSLRLDGLEKGFNDRARERAIVIHGAEYVNATVARAQGRLGRSLGCPAVRPAIAKDLIDAVKEGGLLFAYYPDPVWLNGSAYLN